MRITTIAALFVASVLLIGVEGAVSPAYAYGISQGIVGSGPMGFLDIFSGFAWWGTAILDPPSPQESLPNRS